MEPESHRNEEVEQDQTDRTTAEDGESSSSGTARTEADQERLIPGDTAFDYQQRWEVIQAGFIDEPRESVSEADRLVEEVMGRVSDRFEEQRRALEEQWAQGEPSTEDLRLALRRYRAFFERLLSA